MPSIRERQGDSGRHERSEMLNKMRQAGDRTQPGRDERQHADADRQRPGYGAADHLHSGAQWHGSGPRDSVSSTRETVAVRNRYAALARRFTHLQEALAFASLSFDKRLAGHLP